MTWLAAAQRLEAVLGDLAEVDNVFSLPPLSSDEVRVGVSAMLLPPARTTLRQAGGSTVKMYTQQVTLMSLIADRPETAAARVDAAVEAVDAAMESQVTLGGLVTVCGPFQWQEGFAQEMPEDSGIWYAHMVGAAEIRRTIGYYRSAGL